MAGDDNPDRVLLVCGSYCTMCMLSPNTLGYLTVRGGLSVGNGAQLFPDAFLKRRAGREHGDTEILELTLEIET